LGYCSGRLTEFRLAWKKVIPKIQFHAEMDAIDGIKENIARLDGSIEAEDMDWLGRAG